MWQPLGCASESEDKLRENAEIEDDLRKNGSFEAIKCEGRLKSFWDQLEGNEDKIRFEIPSMSIPNSL